MQHLGCCCESSSGQTEHELTVTVELGAPVHRGLELLPCFVSIRPCSISLILPCLYHLCDDLHIFPSNPLTISTCLYFKRKDYHWSCKWQSGIAINTRSPEKQMCDHHTVPFSGSGTDLISCTCSDSWAAKSWPALRLSPKRAAANPSSFRLCCHLRISTSLLLM